MQRRLAGREATGRSAGIVALGALGVGAILAAVLILPGGGATSPRQAAAPARVAVVTATPRPPAEPASQGPSLHGVPPHFGVAKGASVGEATAGEADAPSGESAGTGSGAAEADEGTATTGEAGATASSAQPVPAGPAAMKVAHRFAEAFVFYEIGEKPARAKAVFAETATEELAKALDEQPPRLPANAKVPKAEVVNLVPGPRFGGQYTVSVSLLRVGVTSELRLTLQKEKSGEWSVAQILG